jgi:hypothetical protein
MKRTTTAALAAVGGFLVLLVAASAAFIDLDDAEGLRGTAIGAGLGIVNLVAGYLVTRRALRLGMKSAMKTLMSGFLLRLMALAGLTLLFQRTDSIDAVAFALTFMLFFFIYLGVEVMLVERSLNGRAA